MREVDLAARTGAGTLYGLDGSVATDLGWLIPWGTLVLPVVSSR
jgi:hypothetical protein